MVGLLQHGVVSGQGDLSPRAELSQSQGAGVTVLVQDQSGASRPTETLTHQLVWDGFTKSVKLGNNEPT